MSNSEWPTETSHEGDASGQGMDFGQALLHRKWMLLFFIGVGVAVGSLIHSRTEPLFASYAKLLIRQNQPTMVDGAGRTGPKNPLETYAVLICSPRIILKAVRESHLTDLPSLPGGESRAAGIIIGGLTAQPHEESTDYLMLSYTGKNQFDAQKILEAVIQAFVKDLEDSRSVLTAGDIKIITEARDKLQTELADEESKYAAFRETAGLLYTQEGGLNIHQQRLTQIEGERSGLIIEKSQTETQLAAIQQALERGAKREALLLMVDQLDQNKGNAPVESGEPPTSFISHLLPLLTEKELLIQKVGSRHPDVLALESRINLTRQLLQEQSGVTVSGEPLDLLSVYVESLREKIGTLNSNIAGMDTLFDQERLAAATISSKENEDRVHREGIELKKSTIRGYIEMLEKMGVASEVGLVSADPTDPPTSGRQVAPVLVRSLAVGAVGGLLVGILLAFLLEMADQSYRSPDDISRQLGVPVVGHIPNIEIGRERKRLGATRLHPSLVTYHRPGSQMAEAYRTVRTALLSGTRNQPHQLIQITSPNPGDGKSTLSTNLAMSIAKAGKSVLLIDADLRRPNVHKLMGMECDIGVTSVVEGGADFDDAIQSGPLPHLDVMTAGPPEKNRAELLLSPRFAEMLNSLRERYDYVIVDTPPLLAVSDPAAIGAMVDGVILVLRINRQARLHAVRARETLDLVGAKLIGVVVNALGDSSAVQGFGTGTRGYRAATYRTLAHGYTDSYGGDTQYRGYDSYYQDSEEPEPLNGQHDLAGSRTEYHG